MSHIQSVATHEHILDGGVPGGGGRDPFLCFASSSRLVLVPVGPQHRPRAQKAPRYRCATGRRWLRGGKSTSLSLRRSSGADGHPATTITLQSDLSLSFT